MKNLEILKESMKITFQKNQENNKICQERKKPKKLKS